MLERRKQCGLGLSTLVDHLAENGCSTSDSTREEIASSVCLLVSILENTCPPGDWTDKGISRRWCVKEQRMGESPRVTDAIAGNKKGLTSHLDPS